MMRTLRDMNMSKFVAEDVPLFLSLIDDLFPGQNADRASFPDVSSALAKVGIPAPRASKPGLAIWTGAKSSIKSDKTERRSAIMCRHPDALCLAAGGGREGSAGPHVLAEQVHPAV